MVRNTGIHTIAIPTPFPVGAVNVYLVETEPLTLVDTGPRTGEGWDALVRGLAELRVCPADIGRIFLTHHHVDHAGLLRRLLGETDAEVWAHPEVPCESQSPEAEEQDRKAFLASVMCELGLPEDVRAAVVGLWSSFARFTEPYTVHRRFTDGGEAGPFGTYFVPGHSATDTLLVHRDAGYTLVGDHILETINPNPLIHRPAAPGAPRPKSLVTYQHSLRRARALELGRCYPGHGGPFNDHRQVVDAILAKHERRNNRVMRLMRADGMTPYAMARALYPDMPLESLYLILSVAVGHMEVLEERGMLRSEYRAGVLHFLPA
jgi:glyoxylase-like metal-dependent hydrolase (beta-lactamase superfamily II)